MKRVVSAIACMLFLGAMNQGCSVGMALSGPPPVAVERVHIGTERNAVISVLGIPKNTEIKDGTKTDMFEFIDGNSNGSKVRVILYLAGDVFTLGLSELLFWPIELTAGAGTKGRAIVKYGLNDMAQSVLLTRADGTAWGYERAEAAVTTNTVLP